MVKDQKAGLSNACAVMAEARKQVKKGGGNAEQKRMVKDQKDGRARAAAARKDDDTWNNFVQQLESYVNKHGHANVPQKEHGKFGRWVKRQKVYYRTYKREGKCNGIYENRVQMFDDIGVDW